MIEFKCIRCKKKKVADSDYVCQCGGLFEVEHTFGEVSLDLFDSKIKKVDSPWSSGVWRYKELIHPQLCDKYIISRPEGNTNLYKRKKIANFLGLNEVFLKHEGENPSGSFKDRGMTVGVSVAVSTGAIKVACASTGNTSASMSAYAAQAGLKSIVLIPDGMIAYGKLAQALAYGAMVIQIKGTFDNAMNLIINGAKSLGFYILNSLNPWRIEGQKSIVFEILQQRRWEVPDWVVLPAGNLGNLSAFGKALRELKGLGLIKKIPKLAAIQAEGANPFYRLWKSKDHVFKPIKPVTIATAINIGNPVSWEKALISIEETKGVVEEVSDNEILNAKAMIDSSGVGCEPASAASVAGAKKLREAGIISKDESVVCILTGNLLKDPETTVQYHLSSINGIDSKYGNKPVQVDASLSKVKEIMNQLAQTRADIM